MMPYQYDLFRDFLVCSQPHNIIEDALKLLSRNLKKKSLPLASSKDVKDYCRLQLAAKEHEIFGCLFLDSQHRLIAFKELFRGTIDGCSVYIREVAKEALAINSAAVILTHNHPSGDVTPSRADIDITAELKKSLGLFDVRVLDHVIVSREGAASLAELGQL